MRLPDLLFRAPYEAFFATTFTFDQAAFDDYFFPRLGAPAQRGGSRRRQPP